MFSFIQTVFSYHHAILKIIYNSLRKQPSGHLATLLLVSPPKKSRLGNERRNFILMKRHYPYLGSASDWLNHVSHAARPIKSTTQIWVVTRHQYGISASISQTSFGRETSGSVAKCRLFSQAKRSIKTLTGSNVKQTIRHLNYELEYSSLFYKLLLSGRSI